VGAVVEGFTGLLQLFSTCAATFVVGDQRLILIVNAGGGKGGGREREREREDTHTQTGNGQSDPSKSLQVIIYALEKIGQWQRFLVHHLQRGHGKAGQVKQKNTCIYVLSGECFEDK
jgi:hypothetical protein